MRDAMKSFAPVALVAVCGLLIAAPATTSAGASPKAQLAKKCKKKYGKKGKKRRCRKGTTTPGPVALGEGELHLQVKQKADAYCALDPYCYDSGILKDNLYNLICTSRAPFRASCFGFNTKYYEATRQTFQCHFLEVIERDGFDGVKSHLDTSFGSGGWSCYQV